MENLKTNITINYHYLIKVSLNIKFTTMENLNNTLHTQNISLFNTVVDRSQSQILAIGYQMVLLKTKIKKRLKIASTIFFFNF
ncbi:hypothetical protein SAMN05421797_102213 [Maribacter ulvicola]|uniref:Uncharacterized protein n=1 Tax=Maribacter ulvicola TaxID=228959 RepID=A0A1N6U5P5_9FLAO|nr:hypothetical protein SAMN05421797_102213 [Maribacter ulvicola]